ncbi:MAG TPA: anthranilate phosphoribosyltransferase [Nitrososphaera sp.]|jgi:anthranilate phosphoribosyltransferase
MSGSQADLRPAIRKLVARVDLSEEEIANTFSAILGGRAQESAIASFLTALAMKGETPTEIRAAVQSIRSHATRITPSVSGPLIDTCGTGGDSLRTFNVSTAAAIVAAAAGAKVAKHGNRSVSGVCGSADFLEAVGLDLDAPAPAVQKCIEKTGIGFLFAPAFHPAMKHAGPARKAIGVRTVFNVAGPLSNPCTNISGQVMGVFEPAFMETLAQVCEGYVDEAMIVHAADGFDELSNTCENDILWVTRGQTRRMRVGPKVVGLAVAKPEQLIVTTKDESVKSTLAAICGSAPAEKEDIVVLNASAALMVGKVVNDLRDGIEVARHAIKTGRAREKLRQMVSECGNKETLEKAEEKYL